MVNSLASGRVEALPNITGILATCPNCGSIYLRATMRRGVKICGKEAGFFFHPDGIIYYDIKCEACYVSLTAIVNTKTGAVSFDGVL